MNDSALAKLDMAQHALAECKTAMEAKQIADVAEAARVYLERTNASTETVNRATEIRLLAERQMGEFLKTMPKNPGGYAPTVKEGALGATLADIGITHKQSSNAQKLADIPEPEFKERIAVARASGGKLSTNAVLARERRSPAQFDRKVWQRQARSMMTSWLQAVPKSAMADAVEFLSELPAQLQKEIHERQ